MQDHEAFLKLAIQEAIQSVEEGQTPFGAIITKNNEVVVSAHNTVITSCDCTAHAEVNAIRMACKKLKTIDLSGCILYSSCEPCPMCFSAIHWAKLDAVYTSASIHDAVSAGFNELHISNKQMKTLGKSPVKIYGDLLKEEGLAPFKLFMSKPERVTY